MTVVLVVVVLVVVVVVVVVGGKVVVAVAASVVHPISSASYSSRNGYSLFPNDLANSCFDLCALNFWEVRRYAEIPDVRGILD